MSLQRLRAMLAATALGIALLLPFVNPAKTLAANESYAWTNLGTISVSGGDLRPTSLAYYNSSGFGTTDNYRATVTHESGCRFVLQVGVSILRGANSGLLDTPVPPDDIPSPCNNSSIQDQYKGDRITITGARPAAPANATIVIWSPNPSSTSPSTIQIKIKSATGQAAEMTARKTTDPNSPSGTLPDKQAVFYKADFSLLLKENTEYTVCSDNTAILNCNATTTGDYTSIACASGAGPSCYNFKTPIGRTAVTYTFNTPVAIDDGKTFCDDTDANLGWLVCGAIDLIASSVEWLEQSILGLLIIRTDPIFNTSSTNPRIAESSAAFRTAWGIFRNIAYAILVIIGLIMIVSQILDLEIVSALTLRKLVPGLALAAILIPLSWPGLELLFSASNDATFAVMDLIKNPFSNLNVPSSVDGGDLTMGALIFVLTASSAAGGIAYLGILGMGGIFALVASAGLAVFSAFILLAARNVVAYFLIVAAPVAIICAVFEPFKKLFTLWKTLTITIALSTIAIGAVFALGQVGALIAFISNDTGIGTITALGILIGSVALIWSILKKLDAVAGQLGNVISATTGRLQKGLSGYRSSTAKRRLEETVEGKRTIGGGAFGYLSNRAAGLVRRGKVAGDIGGFNAFGLGGKTGKSKYAEAVRTMQSRTAAGMVEQDHDRAGGDDDAMRLLARRGMTQDRFLKDYAAIQMRGGATQEVAEQRARNALGLTESSLGAKAGTSAMRIAAQRSLLKSNTAYRKQWVQDKNTGEWKNEEMDFSQMSRQMYGDVAELMEDGLITTADGAAMIKSNGARADRAGVGFGTAMARLNDVATSGVAVLDQPNNDGISHLEAMANEVLIGTGPGQLIGQRHEAVRILAPEMLRRAREVAERDQGQLGREFVEQVAVAAGRLDLGAQLPELNASLNANAFVGERVGDRTMGQWMEFLRNPPNPEDPLYQRILAQQRTQVVATHPGASAADIDATAQAAAQEFIRDAQRVFQEYRREYGSAGWQAQAGRGAGPTAPPGGGGIPGSLPKTP